MEETPEETAARYALNRPLVKDGETEELFRRIRALDDPKEYTCPNCGSSQISWDFANTNRSGIQDGRLQMHDITPIFYTGCDECSETIKHYTVDEILERLNRGR